MLVTLCFLSMCVAGRVSARCPYVHSESIRGADLVADQAVACKQTRVTITCSVNLTSWHHPGHTQPHCINIAESSVFTSFSGTYFNCIMFMVASSVVLTVVVLNYHHRTADIHEMPQWVKTVLLHWFPWFLRMSRPGKKITLRTIKMHKRKKELELKDRSCKSLLTNVLELDDDFRQMSGGPSCGNYLRGMSASTLDETVAHVGGGACSVSQRELQLILRELQFITLRMRQADEKADLISDWKFAAMVVDRFCLIIFTMFTVVATVAVLLSAPHIIVE
ncbi:Hypothetical predicted protein [Cloeon dipterum]|uniref:Neurotransmitter-gated ion-channel transmembrane domain-containing protein n=1 Tax=Cloeon dipterum TaxID=197152 RepID=A0A8S1DUN3_9INSE|nr:Hypothetical predicted protein [Cloeon dipterum]